MSINTILKWQWHADPTCTSRWLGAFDKLKSIQLHTRMQSRPFVVHKLPPDIRHSQMQVTETSLPRYILFVHDRSDYTHHVDTLADAFTELQRLSARNSFCQHSPREYFEKVDSSQSRDAVFANHIARECTSFRPANCVLMKQLLFGNSPSIRVLDPFAGWGDRAIGFAAAGCYYTGMDANAQLLPSYQTLVDFMERHDLVRHRQIRLYHGDSSTYDFGSECYDLVFTCPPYADLEIYDETRDPKPSTLWCAETLLPVFTSAVAAVKMNGYIVFMINVKDSSDTYVHDLMSHLQRMSCRYCGLVGSCSPTNNRPQGMFVFQRSHTRKETMSSV